MNGEGFLAVNRLEIMERHWYNHNRDPYKNKNLFEDQLRRVSHIDEHVLSKAVELLAGEDVFPKIKKVIYHSMVLSPKTEVGTVDCNKCGSNGLIIGVVFIKDNINMDVVSYDHVPRPDGNYTTRIVGRCDCENGRAYELVNGNVMGKIVQPDQFLVNAAAKNGWDATFEANVAAQHFRDKADGIDRKGLSDGPLAQLINKLMGEASE